MVMERHCLIEGIPGVDEEGVVCGDVDGRRGP
jgi:hypothetical protein